MEDRDYVVVRATRPVMSNDRRQLLVLEGTIGALLAVTGSPDRPRFLVVFATAIMLGVDGVQADAKSAPSAGDHRHDGSRADLGARPVRVQQWAEVLVGLTDIALDPALDVFGGENRPPWVQDARS